MRVVVILSKVRGCVLLKLLMVIRVWDVSGSLLFMLFSRLVKCGMMKMSRKSMMVEFVVISIVG